MSSRPEVVDAQGGPITGNAGGPMPLAKLAARWSHVAGKRQRARARGERAAPGERDPEGSGPFYVDPAIMRTLSFAVTAVAARRGCSPVELSA